MLGHLGPPHWGPLPPPQGPPTSPTQPPRTGPKKFRGAGRGQDLSLNAPRALPHGGVWVGVWVRAKKES